MHLGLGPFPCYGRIKFCMKEAQGILMTDYVVKDITLADYGRKELDIAETEMPG